MPAVFFIQNEMYIVYWKDKKQMLQKTCSVAALDWQTETKTMPHSPIPELFLFLTREGPGRPRIIHYVGYNFTRRSFGIFCPGKPKFEERPSKIARNTLRQKNKKQSGPWAPPPPVAGDLKTLPPRCAAKLLDSRLSTTKLIRRSLLLLRGRTTWRWRDDELRRTEHRASVLEVEDGPLARPKSATLL
jgi:hypothetical protein